MRLNLIRRIPCKKSHSCSVDLSVAHVIRQNVVTLDAAHRSLINCLSLRSVRQMRSVCKVLTLVKIKHGAPETRFNPCLIYFASLEQTRVELTDEHIEAHGGAGGSYLFCTKAGMKLRYDVKN